MIKKMSWKILEQRIRCTQIQQVFNEIGKILSIRKPDREIMEQLQIKRLQYFEYTSKLFQQSAELLDRFNFKSKRLTYLSEKDSFRKTNSSFITNQNWNYQRTPRHKVVTTELLSI